MDLSNYHVFLDETKAKNLSKIYLPEDDHIIEFQKSHIFMGPIESYILKYD
jgi:hypothetical protein